MCEALMAEVKEIFSLGSNGVQVDNMWFFEQNKR